MRQLFTKMSKGPDIKNVVLAKQEANIGELEALISQIRSKKRQEVITDPNSLFVRINEVRRTRIRMEEALNPESAAQEAQMLIERTGVAAFSYSSAKKNKTKNQNR